MIKEPLETRSCVRISNEYSHTITKMEKQVYTPIAALDTKLKELAQNNSHVQPCAHQIRVDTMFIIAFNDQIQQTPMDATSCQ